MSRKCVTVMTSGPKLRHVSPGVQISENGMLMASSIASQRTRRQTYARSTRAMSSANASKPNAVR